MNEIVKQCPHCGAVESIRRFIESSAALEVCGSCGCMIISDEEKIEYLKIIEDNKQ